MTSPPERAAAPSVRLERVLRAAIDVVYAAWTDPAVMARWLSPTGRADVEADVRVGGRLRVVMVGDDRTIEHTGEYRAVEPPTLLSFTWRSPYTGAEPSVVTIQLHARDADTTHLLLLHERLPGDAAASHEGGWTAIVDNLAALLGRDR